MEITAFAKSTQVAPRKVRIVADLIRKQTIDEALVSLAFLRKRGASVLEKTLRSAVANAVSRNVERNSLSIERIDVSEGPAYKRFHASTRGRIHPYKKRTSHIRIVLTDNKNQKLSKGEKDGTKS
ncbi:MAG: 50S ribosomal protein L22 [Patescibacteria group bacterium]